jgi:hypothetical protein
MEDVPVTPEDEKRLLVRVYDLERQVDLLWSCMPTLMPLAYLTLIGWNLWVALILAVYVVVVWFCRRQDEKNAWLAYWACRQRE